MPLWFLASPTVFWAPLGVPASCSSSYCGFCDFCFTHLTTRQTTIGPTAVNSLMSYNYAGGTPYKAVSLAFFAGFIEILCAVFNLGFLIQFISQPVITAFSSAVSIQVGSQHLLYRMCQVITSQVKGLFGISGFKGRGFVNVWTGMFSNISSIQWYDTAVGLLCMLVLYFLRVSSKLMPYQTIQYMFILSRD